MGEVCGDMMGQLAFLGTASFWDGGGMIASLVYDAEMNAVDV